MVGVTISGLLPCLHYTTDAKIQVKHFSAHDSTDFYSFCVERKKTQTPARFQRSTTADRAIVSCMHAFRVVYPLCASVYVYDACAHVLFTGDTHARNTRTRHETHDTTREEEDALRSRCNTRLTPRRWQAVCKRARARSTRWRTCARTALTRRAFDTALKRRRRAVVFTWLKIAVASLRRNDWLAVASSRVAIGAERVVQLLLLLVVRWCVLLLDVGVSGCVCIAPVCRVVATATSRAEH